ncbi:MAG TPA: ferritin family protein, partial [Syntrophorhabdus sp.]|nr:ferritin family protein [Syntrophorhabdus sp.]
MSKTEDGLKEAFAGESQANRKYLAFAKKAEEEGYKQVAKLFRAAAEAETVHAHNHLRELKGIKSTKENLESAISGESYEFAISDKPYDKLFDDVLKMLYMMRCGSELEKKHAGEFAHEACHAKPATIYGTTKTKDVTGGWHDAGDYGRYVIPG